MKRQDSHLALLLAGSFLLFALGSWTLPLLGPDEPRYSQVAREMLQRRDFITPTLAGRPWFEKPVLLYWLQAFSYWLFGVNEWSARFPSMIAAVFTVFMVTFTARRFLPSRTALLCGAVPATSVFLIGFGRAATFDMLLTACVTISLCAFLLFEVGKKPRWLWVAYASVGGGLLAKGLVAPAVIGLAMLTYLVISGRIRNLRYYKPIQGGMLALGVAAIWFLPVYLIHGSRFWDDFFLQHHLARYTTSGFHRSEGLFFYVPILLLGAFPWTPALFLKAAQNESTRRIRQFSWCWLISSLIFFSLSQSKLPGYILPAAPAFAFLAATGLNEALQQKKRVLLLFSILMLLVVAALLASVSRFDVARAPVVAMAGILAFLTVAGLLLFAKGRLRPAFFSGVLVPVAGILLTLLWIYPRSDWEESRKLAEVVRPELTGNRKLLLYNVYDFGLVFYTNGRVELTHEGYFPPVQNDRDLYRYLLRNGELYVVAGNEELDWMERVRFWRVRSVLRGRHRSIVILQRNP